MVFEPTSIGDHSPIYIKGEIIKQVSSYKSLEVYFDDMLDWQTHVSSICSRIHQRLHLQRLRIFGVGRKRIIFCIATIELILHFGITSRLGHFKVNCKAQISSLIRTAGKVMGQHPLHYPEKIYIQGDNILNDPSHVAALPVRAPKFRK